MNLRRKVAALAGGIAALPLVLIALPSTPANAHGWITSPPSRQDMCATGRVANCGPIQYEPQSVEGAKGQRNCNAGLAQFAVLNDAGRFPATSSGSTVTFNWRLTVNHRTTTWEYWLGSRLLASFNQNNQQPPMSLSHTVSGIPSGRQTVLAIWNIADTPMAFYACVDLQVGGGNPNPTTAPPPTTRPPTQTTPPPSQGGTWSAGSSYAVGARVTYGGRTYQCLQAHTAIAGWEPPNVPALWRAL